MGSEARDVWNSLRLRGMFALTAEVPQTPLKHWGCVSFDPNHNVFSNGFLLCKPHEVFGSKVIRYPGRFIHSHLWAATARADSGTFSVIQIQVWLGESRLQHPFMSYFGFLARNLSSWCSTTTFTRAGSCLLHSPMRHFPRRTRGGREAVWKSSLQHKSQKTRV